MKLSRRAFLGTIPTIPSAANAFGLGAGDMAFEHVVRQIGGIGDISPYLLDAVGSEFRQAYGTEAQAEFTRILSSGPIDARIAAAPAEVKTQAAFAARLLYTGEVTRDGKQVTLYYPWCLAWKALTFATAPGLCGGPSFGHWQNPPIPGAM
jgi:hypothetical protein